MNIKNIKIELENDEDQQLHRINVLDANKREKIQEGNWVSLEKEPFVVFNGLLIQLINGRVWMDLESLVAFINGPKIIEEVAETKI